MYKVQFLKSAAKEFRALDDAMNTRVNDQQTIKHQNFNKLVSQMEYLIIHGGSQYGNFNIIIA